MNSAWFKLVAVTLASAVALSGCKVTTGDDEDIWEEGGTSSGGKKSGGAGSGGKASGGAGTGGTSSGGASSGGTSSGGTSSGGTSTGGTSTGGTQAFSCMEDGVDGTPASTCQLPTAGLSEPEKDCYSCLSTNCCTALKECFAENPRNQCQGTAETGWEVGCIQSCLIEIVAEDFNYDQDDEDMCASQCAVGNGCSFIADSTQAAFVCLKEKCEDECVYDLAMP